MDRQNQYRIVMDRFFAATDVKVALGMAAALHTQFKCFGDVLFPNTSIAFGDAVGRPVALTVEETQMAFDILSALYLENTETGEQRPLLPCQLVSSPASKVVVLQLLPPLGVTLLEMSDGAQFVFKDCGCSCDHDAHCETECMECTAKEFCNDYPEPEGE